MKTTETSKHTPGPWTWEGDHVLRPAEPEPQISAVHTILSPEGCYGYLAADLKDVLAESDGNHALIAAAPDLLDALMQARHELARLSALADVHDINTAVAVAKADAAIAKASEVRA